MFRTRVAVNLAVLLVICGFAGYAFMLVSDRSVEYAAVSGEQSAFVSPCVLESTHVLSHKAERMRLSGGCVYVAASDSVYVYDKDMLMVSRFHAGGRICDIAVDGNGEVYALHETGVRVFTHDGRPVRRWEACGDNSLYASIALSSDYVFVTDAENKNICQYSRDGLFVRFIDSPSGFLIPAGSFGISAFRDTVRCINPGRRQVESYTVDGLFISSFGIPGSRPGAFSGCCNPVSIAFTDEGRLLTSEKGNPRICLFDVSGRFIEMLLNSKSLGGGHEACEVQSEGSRIYVGRKNRISIYERFTG